MRHPPHPHRNVHRKRSTEGHNIGKIMNKRLWLVMALLALAALACGSEETGSEPAAFSGELNRITPDELSEVLEAGPATVVNFWASWCGPCRAEAPLLTQAHNKYGDRVRFIGVAVDDTVTAASKFIDEYQIPFHNYMGGGSEMMAAYEAFGIPFTVFTDSGGEVLNVHRGIIDEQVLSVWSDELTRLG